MSQLWGRDDCISNEAEDFYSIALDRIRHFMLVLGVAGTVTVWAVLGWKLGLGVLVGSAIAYANFHWLKQVVTALADRVTNTGSVPSGGGMVLLFLLRYGLLAIVANAIFVSSPASLNGFFGGLFLAVAAILCEAGYEVYTALRREF
jgi:hypothetical protein